MHTFHKIISRISYNGISKNSFIFHNVMIKYDKGIVPYILGKASAVLWSVYKKLLVTSKHTNANITKRKTLKEDIDGKG